MDEVVPTLDDSDRIFRHHPNDSVGERFSFDPESADAAADLAGELGSDFVEGATRGRDMSDVMLSEEEELSMSETPYLIETIGEEGEEMNLPEDEYDELEASSESEELDDAEASSSADAEYFDPSPDDFEDVETRSEQPRETPPRRRRAGAAR